MSSAYRKKVTTYDKYRTTMIYKLLILLYSNVFSTYDRRNKWIDYICFKCSLQLLDIVSSTDVLCSNKKSSLMKQIKYNIVCVCVGYHLVCVYWHILDTVVKLYNTIYFAFKRFEIHFRNPLLFARILCATCCRCLLQLKLFFIVQIYCLP